MTSSRKWRRRWRDRKVNSLWFDSKLALHQSLSLSLKHTLTRGGDYQTPYLSPVTHCYNITCLSLFLSVSQVLKQYGTTEWCMKSHVYSLHIRTIFTLKESDSGRTDLWLQQWSHFFCHFLWDDRHSVFLICKLISAQHFLKVQFLSCYLMLLNKSRENELCWVICLWWEVVTWMVQGFLHPSPVLTTGH